MTKRCAECARYALPRPLGQLFFMVVRNERNRILRKAWRYEKVRCGCGEVVDTLRRSGCEKEMPCPKCGRRLIHTVVLYPMPRRLRQLTKGRA